MTFVTVRHSAELDREYDPSFIVGDAQQYVRGYIDESAATRIELPCALGVPYGEGPDETVDVFPAESPGAPVLVFIHGGYWQAFSSKEFSFVARGPHAHGFTVVVTNHSLCPKVTIADITRQSRAAMAWVHREIHAFHGDPRRIFVAGHSAGGQQVGRLVSTRWREEYGVPDDVIKGAIAISGLFDLLPLRHCSMQRTLALSPELARAESPLLVLPDAAPPLLVSFGGDESQSFHHQSIDYLTAWRGRGLEGQLFVQTGRNHFDAIAGLGDGDSTLCRVIVDFVARCERGERATDAEVDEEPPRSGRRISQLPKPPDAVAAAAPLPRPQKAPPVPMLEKVPRGAPLPTSFAQQRLWFVAQLFPRSPLYNEPILIHVEGSVDGNVLRDCLTEITRRHEAFRTVFPVVDGEPFQEIAPPGPFDLDVVDLSNLPPAAREPEAMRLAARHARKPFDLRVGPLVRALFVRSSETEARLVVTAHHIVVDGVSFFNVFLPELTALYGAFSRGEPSPLPELPFHYADFASWQRRWLTEETLAPKLAYWRRHLAGSTEVSMPTDFVRPANPSAHGARVPLSLSAELTARLREIGRRAGVTLFTTLLAAWKTLLFRYTGQNDIAVGSAAAGRPRPELEGLIGFFNNNLVLRTQLDGSKSFADLLPKVGEVLRAAREHQDVPFDRLVAEVGATRNPNKNPLYDTTFILMPPLPPLEGTPRFSAGRFDIGVAKVDLYLELHQRPSGLVGHIEYQTELFSVTTMERMVGHFRMLLEGIARDPELPLGRLPLLTEIEQQQIRGFQGPATPPRPDDEWRSLEQLFEARADLSPDAIAIEHGSERLSYAALDARANRLAHHLRSRGVGADSLCGICLDRSIDAVVAILGVLKAGGAYVPLDPSYPRERLAFMMEDADLRVLLASSKTLHALPEGSDRKAILLDQDWPTIARNDECRLEPIATAAHLAYVIYTSGSTGRPKGVMVERRGLYHLARAQERTFGLGEGSRVLQFFSLNFDGSVWDFTLAWPVGATLVLADRESLLPGPGLVELLEEENINAVVMTPSALSLMPYAHLPALFVLITAGEALAEELVTRWAPGRRFFNAYGPTEATVAAVLGQCRAAEGKPSIGRPLDFVDARILSDAMLPVPVGVPGELYIGGPGLARGYLHRPELTASRLFESPALGVRLYKTGDLVKWRADGTIDFLGRTDDQVKLRGFRVELGEIEAQLGHHPSVQMAAVRVWDVQGDKRLVAYVVPRADAPAISDSSLKQYLRERLPEHMVPATFLVVDRMPVNPSGKVDRAALSAPPSRRPSVAPESTSLERTVADVWREVLGTNDFDFDTPFFEAGGHSLTLARLQARLAAKLGKTIPIMTLLGLPTVRQTARHLAALPGVARGSLAPPRAMAPAPSAAQGDAIAIVGMAIRAPGVRTPEDLWEVVHAGRETIRVLSPEALIEGGADPARVRRPEFVAAEGVLEDADRFDAAFFGYNDADALLLDPQQRLFLECAHEALEHAGYDAARFDGRIAVFGGAGMPRYWMGPVADALRTSGSEQERYRAQTLNAPDFLATRVAFKLGLRGPAVSVQTACSTSLSAVHMARQSLLSGECDMALAGGVSLTSLGDADRGYLRTDGGIESEDGHCRPFDAEATGIVKSSGTAIVVLKRLAMAIADGDTIHAVVLGSGMTNDGADKVGFTAPSEEGVAAAIERAYEAAGVDPTTIGFVEAHGTGTRLGDPTEVRALSRAYRRWTEERGYCALGALKANLGHMDAAAGAAGLIKAALVLARETIPPIPGFRTPNPLLDLPSTPFYVADSPRPFPRTNVPRRAAVSALGLGGTNVHVVLEEAPRGAPTGPSRPFQLLCISARTEAALSAVAQRLGAHLSANPSLDIADVAHTLALGRRQERCRATIVCRDTAGAMTSILSTPQIESARPTKPGTSTVVFLFPGHGVQYAQMGRGLYETESVFREAVDRCFEILRAEHGQDLAPLLSGDPAGDEQRLDEMAIAQPFLFTMEFAMARQIMAWGVRPSAMLGHSLGEYVAACLAGVFSLEDAISLVATRGRLMDETPSGSMLTAFADESAIEPRLEAGVTIATYAPGCVVLAGAAEAIADMRARLGEAGIETTGVRVSRASHSPWMRAIRDEFRARVAAVSLRAPTVPVLSNATGTYLSPEQATSPDYWADHLCKPVRLREAIGEMLELDSPTCIELGPGVTLGSFVKAHPRRAAAACEVVGTLPGYRQREEPPHTTLLSGLGRLWELGVDIDWRAFYLNEQRRRVPLPTYPFEGRHFMLGAAPNDEVALLDKRANELARKLAVRPIGDVPGLRPRLEELCASLVLDFFARRLGESLGRPATMKALREAAGVVPAFGPMFEALVEILVRAGLASRASAGEIRLDAERAGRSADLATRLRRDFPSFKGLVRFIEHCIGHYDEALTGETEPVGVLYPDGTDAFYQSCVRDTANHSYRDVYTTMAREVVVDIVRRRSDGRPIRILEIGAGHGTLTWPLVEQLRGANVEYHFTDIGRSFLLRAEEQAARRELDFVTARRFDLNRPPAEQGFHERYDVILALNAVHVADDLPAALEDLHALTVPGGSLVLVELSRFETWDVCTWGLAPGFWEIVHARGSLSMDHARWEDVLRRSAFGRVTCVSGDSKRRSSEDQCLLIAERSRLAPRPSQPPLGALASNSSAAKYEDDGVVASSENDVEELVRSAWRRMLGVSRVPNGASFFELGGDSLLAVQMVAELRAKTGREIKMRSFVAAPTIENMMILLGAPRDSVVPPVAIESAAARVPAPGEAPVRAFLERFAHWTQARYQSRIVDALWASELPCVLVPIDGVALFGAEAIERHYARSLGGVAHADVRVSKEEITMFEGGKSACVTMLIDSDLTLVRDAKRVAFRGVRASLVLVEQGNEWRAVQVHYSLPMGARSTVTD